MNYSTYYLLQLWDHCEKNNVEVDPRLKKEIKDHLDFEMKKDRYLCIGPFVGEKDLL